MTNLSRTAAAVIAVAAASLTTLAAPAHAGSLDFLNHMSPAYTSCVNNVTKQIAPGQMTGAVQTSIDTACNNAHPAFPSTATSGFKPGTRFGSNGFGVGHRHGFL